AIRRASVNLAWEGKKFPWDFNVLDKLKVIDAGDLVFDCGDAEDFTYRQEAATSEILKAAKPCWDWAVTTSSHCLSYVL
ncbi:hypothetical protein OFN42_43270, partial [Escherichia coli]|nr:hypothetical protein [Escherichia coli]